MGHRRWGIWATHKDPAEKDLSATFQNEIVKKLPLPSCIKGKMHFPKTLFGTEIVR